MPEILAPCGDLKTFETAINNSADAVYLGLSKFNARLKSENFTEKNLKDVVKRAHLFGTKVYVTLNTAIKDKEFKELEKHIMICKKANIDAFIISDLGVLSSINKLAPNIPLHASTQMGVSNYYAAKLLKELGFDRVVLARETPLNEIKKIKEKTNLEIEYFVHGAVCVAYSGACLFSAINNGNSGNRGLCLQPCRKKYACEEFKKDGYLLSIKDQSLVDNLDDLIEAGVDSFKIEGRLKSPSYVKNAILLYKEKLNNNTVNQELLKNAKVAFNRGNHFKGYAFQSKNLIFDKLQNNYGAKIGKVLKQINNNEMVISSDVELQKGDGLKILENDFELGGFAIQKIEKISNNKYKISCNKKYKINSDVHLTFSQTLENQLLNEEERKISIDFELKSYIDEPSILKAKYGKTIIEVESKFKTEKAKKSPSKKESIIRQLSKIGNTNFKLNKISLDVSENIFIPNSVLNELRRNALDLLSKKILESYQVKDRKNLSKAIDIISEDTSELIFELNDKIDFSFFDKTFSAVINIQDYDDNKTLYDLIDFYQEQANNIYLKLPVFLISQQVEQIENILKQYKNLGVYANNYSHVEIARKLSRKVLLGINLNIFNKHALGVFVNKPVFINSVELMEDELNKGGYVYSYGNIPLMHLNHSPVKEHADFNDGDNYKSFNYKDKIASFVVRAFKLNNVYQYTLFNDRPINLLSNKDYLKNKLYIDLSYTKAKKQIIDAVQNNKTYDESNTINTLRGVY